MGKLGIKMKFEMDIPSSHARKTEAGYITVVVLDAARGPSYNRITCHEIKSNESCSNGFFTHCPNPCLAKAVTISRLVE